MLLIMEKNLRVKEVLGLKKKCCDGKRSVGIEK
jgi:hypothetical protein